MWTLQAKLSLQVNLHRFRSNLVVQSLHPFIYLSNKPHVSVPIFITDIGLVHTTMQQDFFFFAHSLSCSPAHATGRSSFFKSTRYACLHDNAKLSHCQGTNNGGSTWMNGRNDKIVCRFDLKTFCVYSLIHSIKLMLVQSSPWWVHIL